MQPGKEAQIVGKGASTMSKTTNSRLTMAQYSVISAGVVIFILLLFADKTALSSRNPAVANRDAQPQANAAKTEPSNYSTAGLTTAMLPPLPESVDATVVKKLTNKLSEAADGQAKQQTLQQLVAASLNLSRVDYAALYQKELWGENHQSAALRKAADLSRDAAQATGNDTLLGRRFNTEAISLYGEYLKLHPEDQDVRIEQSLRYIHSGDPRITMNGILALRSLVTEHPENLRANQQLGIFSIQTRQFDKAEIRLKQALKLAPNNAETLYYLGVALANESKTAEAKTYLNEALHYTQDGQLKQAITHELGSLPG